MYIDLSNNETPHVSRSLLLLPFLSCLTLDRLNRIRDFISSLPAVATSNINNANHSLSVHQDLPIFLCLSLSFSLLFFFFLSFVEVPSLAEQ